MTIATTPQPDEPQRFTPQEFYAIRDYLSDMSRDQLIKSGLVNLQAALELSKPVRDVVVLSSIGERVIQVIKVIRDGAKAPEGQSILGLGQAKTITDTVRDGTPFTIDVVSPFAGHDLVRELQALGATAEYKQVR